MHASDPVNRVMTQPVLSIEVNASVQDMLQMFVDYPVHHLPVVKSRFVVGMLSSADLMKLEFFLPPPGPARDAMLSERFRVDRLMREPVITITEHETVQRAAELMAKNGIHSLPVINSKNHLVGIVTTTDLIHSCLRGGPAPTSDSTDHFAAIDARIADALIAARSIVSAGTDEQGVAAALLQLQQRMSALESVAHVAKRYLNAGQDERLHTALAKAVERVNRLDQKSSHFSMLGLDVAT